VHVFHLNNLSNNKWFNFKIPSRSIYTIIPFPTCFLSRHLKSIVSEFYHVLVQGQALGLQFDQSSKPFDYPNFLHNISYVTWTTPSFYCKHPSMCAHISLTLWVSTSYIMFMATNALEPMMHFMTPLSPLREMLVSTWDKNNYMHFFQPYLVSFVDESTLCLPKMTFTP
jgi:hypothetical protein